MWFGEAVPMMDVAISIVGKADVFLLTGTSMVVYPAAGLIDFVPAEVPKYIVDPKVPEVQRYQRIEFIQEKASTGMEKFKKMILA